MEEERRMVREILRTKSRYFKYFDGKTLDEIVRSMHKSEHKPRNIIMNHFQAARNLYVLTEGTFLLIDELENKLYLPVGSVYAEQEMLAKMIRLASIIAESRCTVWSLGRDEFKAAIRRTSAVHKNTEFLRSVPIFRNYTREMLNTIEETAKVEFYDTDETIPVQSDNLYVISNGHLKITKNGTNDEREQQIVKVLGTGDNFDEKTIGVLSAFFPGLECVVISKKVLDKLQEEEINDQADNRTEDEYCDIELEDLRPVATIGCGAFGRVELVRYLKSSDRSFALKKIQKTIVVKKNQQDHTLNERNILLKIKNPFITRCYRTFRDERYVYFLSEVCLGGDVLRILNRLNYLDEDVARFITACVIEALGYLHNQQIIYRDLKPENLVIDRNGYVKLTDFGLSKCLGYTGRTFSFCGTFPYYAPENILNMAIDKGVDCWSLGILMYELLSGDLLFGEDDRLVVYDAILNGADEIYFSRIYCSQSSEDLIKKLCVKEPSRRLGYHDINEIKEHRWFDEFDWSGLTSLTLPAPRILIPLLRGNLDASHFETCDLLEQLPREEKSNWDVDF